MLSWCISFCSLCLKNLLFWDLRAAVNCGYKDGFRSHFETISIQQNNNITFILEVCELPKHGFWAIGFFLWNRIEAQPERWLVILIVYMPLGTNEHILSDQSLLEFTDSTNDCHSTPLLRKLHISFQDCESSSAGRMLSGQCQLLFF